MKEIQEAPLPVEFVEHFAREEAALDAMVLSLQEVRNGLLKNDAEAFAVGLEHQAQAAQDSDDLHQRRREVLAGVARQIGLAETAGNAEAITLRKLAESLPGSAADWVRDCRERLAAKAAEMQKLNRQNATIIRQSAELAREVLATLTKETRGADGYDSSGARQEAASGSIFEVGG